MKRLIYIWILILIYIICSARGCTEDTDTVVTRDEKYIINLKDSVRHAFMSDSLPHQLLRAYELTAKEKLNDFADYLKIISDTTLDLRFRQHAAELVRDMFVPGEIELHKWSRIYSEPGLNTLERLLTHSLSEGISCWIQPLQIEVSIPLTRENDSTFAGNLSFDHKCVFFNSRDTSEIVPGKLEIDIYLIKKLKPFGKEQFRVWEVSLGEIE